MSTYRIWPPAPRTTPPGSNRDDLALIALLFLIGALPLLGALLTGHWNQTEMSLGTLLLLFAGHLFARLLRASPG